MFIIQNPIQTKENLEFFTKEQLISHISWLYRYIEELHKNVRDISEV